MVHYGIAVADVPALGKVRERQVAVGADVGEVQQRDGTTRSLFFRDVDGMGLEVCAEKS